MKTLRFVQVLFVLAFFLGSCQSNFYSPNDFKKVKKIDAHIHYLSENNAFSDIARDDNFILIDINFDSQDTLTISEMEKFSLIQKRQFPDRFEFLTSFTLTDWDSANWSLKTIEKLRKSFENGALGVKIWKNIGMNYRDSSGSFIMIDSPRFDEVFRFISDQDKSVLAHLGEPRNCWLPLEDMTTSGDREYFGGNPEYHMYLHPDYPSYEKQMEARDQIPLRYPDLRFIGAHLGSMEWSVDEIAKGLDKFPNMAVDLSARLAHLQLQSISDYDKVRSFIIKYQDRIIYGSDEWIDTEKEKDPAAFKARMHEVWMEQWKYLVTDECMNSKQIEGVFKGLKLPKTVIDKIYCSNAINWYKF